MLTETVACASTDKQRSKQWVDSVREDLQIAGLSYGWWRKIPRQGRLEGCHRMSVAKQLIYGLESLHIE